VKQSLPQRSPRERRQALHGRPAPLSRKVPQIPRSAIE